MKIQAGYDVDMEVANLMELIDSMSTKQLLEHWRFDPPGSKFFVGPIGDYFTKRIIKMRNLNPAAWTQASKELGWRKR